MQDCAGGQEIRWGTGGPCRGVPSAIQARSRASGTRLLGRGQAVRRGTLAPVCEGSNPSAPANTDAHERPGERGPARGTRRGRTAMQNGQLKIFSGTAHAELAREIATYIGVPLGRSKLRRFTDTEVSFQIDENIRGTDVFILQPTCTPVDPNLVELCVMIDAFRRSSAARITAVMPYYGYARQDRKDKPRVPISAKLVANLVSAAGANRILTMDLHKAQIQAFFDIPVDHLFAAPVFIDYLRDSRDSDVTIVSPDAGGVERARAYARRMSADLAIIDKRRSDDGSAEVMNVVGEVKERVCIIVDDIVDTAGTLTQAAAALRANGASRVMACAVHGVLSGPAFDRIHASELEKLVVTNTIPPKPDFAASDKVEILSVAPLLGKAIQSIHQETSVSSLFI